MKLYSLTGSFVRRPAQVDHENAKASDSQDDESKGRSLVETGFEKALSVN